MHTKTVIVSGMTFAVREGALGRWDQRILDEVPRHYAHAAPALVTARRVVDIGAHIGGFTVWAKTLNQTMAVAAIEPDADNSALLMRNTAHLKQVRLYHAWCGYQEPANPVLMRSLTNSGNAAVVAHAAAPTWFDAPVAVAAPPRITLEDVLAIEGWDGIDVLKIDCEGAEYDILQHTAMRTLANTRLIIGEYHDGIQRFRRDLLPRLRQWFDTVHVLEADDWGLFCLKRRKL